MKYIKRIILLILISLLILLSLLFITVGSNKNYDKNLIKEVEDNYKIEGSITKVNKYDNNYIVITDNLVLILNSKYEKIKEESIHNLASLKEEDTLIYKNNKLVIEHTILKKDKVVYEYYDAYTYEYLDNMILEE